MNAKRNWVTPLTTGAFLLSALTGILMFFHLDTGLVKWVHEWFSWLFVFAVLIHIVLNFKPLKKHVSTKMGMTLVGVFIALFIYSLTPIANNGPKSEKPFVAPIKALAGTPIKELALISHVSEAEMMDRFFALGIEPSSNTQTLNDLVPNQNFGEQMRVIAKLMQSSDQP